MDWHKKKENTMTQPTQEVKQEFTYAVDQQVSVNAFIDIDVNGENVRFQITNRYNSTAEKIVKVTEAAIEAFALLRTAHPKPVGTPAVVRSEAVQGEKKPFELKPVPAGELPEGLPEGIECFKDDFDYFEITPQSDSKTSISFYKDNLKFPIGARINKWKNENVLQALHALGGEFDLSKAAKVRVAGSQYWSKGAEYVIASGAHAGEKSHYKDLRMITASL
jgi:hypothetical protein